MEHYVTLFNKDYIPQGITLFNSMKNFCGKFTLWIICLDEVTLKYLSDLHFKEIICLNIDQILSKDILKLKYDRSFSEFCWTITPNLPTLIFQKDKTVKRVTYIDADICFFKSPTPIFQEFENSDSAVLITEHSYLDIVDQTNTSGTYCVQFVIFKRDISELILEIWKQQCIIWCSSKYESGKFGDQKYLDSWPALYSNLVHVLSKTMYCQAPWNSIKFEPNEAIFFHFHGTKILTSDVISIGTYPLKKQQLDYFYTPYAKQLFKTQDTVKFLLNIKFRFTKVVVLRIYLFNFLKKLLNRKPNKLIFKRI